MFSLKFSPPQIKEPGTIASILRCCYSKLVSSDPELWNPEIQEWKQFDKDIYKNPETVGNSTFLSWWGKRLVGFGSFDPRQIPVIITLFSFLEFSSPQRGESTYSSAHSPNLPAKLAFMPARSGWLPNPFT
jgi:hypothetical protein